MEYQKKTATTTVPYEVLPSYVYRVGDEVQVTTAGDARFVPLLGQFGFKDS